MCFLSMLTVKWIPESCELCCQQVKKVNGVEIENLKHLWHLVENCTTENVRFDLDDDRVIVMDYHQAKIATSRILGRHRIPSAVSNDLLDTES